VKEVDRHLFFDKVKSFGIDSCLYEILKSDLVDDMKLRPPVTFPNVYCYLIVTPVDFTGKKLKEYNFVISGWVKSLQVLKRNSAYHSDDMFTVIRAEARPSQRVNKKPHKVWVAAQTDGTILLSADMTVPYGIISLSSV